MRILPSRYPQTAALVARVTRAHVSEAARVSADAVSAVVEVVARDVDRDVNRMREPARLPDPQHEVGLRLLEAGSPAQRDAWLRLCAARGYGAQGGRDAVEVDAPKRLGRLVDVTVA